MVVLGQLSNRNLANKLNRKYRRIVKRIRAVSDIQKYALAKRLKFFTPQWNLNELRSGFRGAIKQFISSFPEIYLNEDFGRVRNVITRRIFGIPTSKQVKKGKGVGKFVRKMEKKEIRGNFFAQRLDIYKSLYEKILPFEDEFELPFVDIVEKLQKLQIGEYVIPQVDHPQEVVSEVRNYISKKIQDIEFHKPKIHTPDSAAKVGDKDIAIEIKEFGPPKKTYNQILKYLKNYDEVILACPDIPDILSKEEITKQEFIDYFKEDMNDLNEKVSDATAKLRRTYSKLWNYTHEPKKLNFKIPEECVLVACMEVSYGNIPKLRYKLKEVKAVIDNYNQMDFNSIITTPIGQDEKYKFVKIRLE